MAYKNNIPQSTDLLSQSQDDILNNFQEIKTFLEINHEDFNAAGQGKHIHVTFPIQAAAPSTAANEVALYSKDDALGDPALYYRPESDGTEVEITAAKKDATGYTILPSGIKIKWGTGTVGANAASTATYDATSAFTSVYNASVTLNGTIGGMDKSLVLTSFTTTQISVYNSNASGGNRTYYYFVIGI